MNVIIEKSNMQQIIFTTKYHCELCKSEQIVNLYGDPDSSFTKNDEPELIEWARHFHWIDRHRVCAICGDLVISGELDLAVNDGTINIHSAYTDHYRNIKQGDQFGSLLIVHENCIQKYGKEAKNQ